MIYCIVCQSCNLMYIGENRNTLLTRLNQHLYNIEQNKLTLPLVQHFQVHFPQHLSIMGQRRRHEGLWICKLRTEVPSDMIPLPPQNWKKKIKNQPYLQMYITVCCRLLFSTMYTVIPPP